MCVCLCVSVRRGDLEGLISYDLRRHEAVFVYLFGPLLTTDEFFDDQVSWMVGLPETSLSVLRGSPLVKTQI